MVSTMFGILLVLLGVGEVSGLHAIPGMIRMDNRGQRPGKAGSLVRLFSNVTVWTWVEVAAAGPSFPDATSAQI